jgi:HEAT repeat protein
MIRSAFLALLLLAPAGPALALDWASTLQKDIKDLDAEDPAVRLRALRRLARLPPRRARPHLLKGLEDISVKVRREAATLAADQRLLAALPTYQRWLSHWDAEMRILAAECLGKLGSPRAVKPLVRVIGDPEQKVRLAVIHAIGKLNTRNRQEVVPLLARLSDTSTPVRKAVVEVLARKGDRRAVIPLMGKLQDGASEVRQAACEALGKLGDSGAGPALVRLLRDSKASVALAAIKALARLRYDRATEPLIDLLKTGPSRMRNEVALALGALGGARAMEALVAGLGDNELRQAATRALVAAGPRAAPQVVALLQDPRAAGSRAGAALEIAARARLRQAVPPLLHLLRSRRLPELRVVQALAQIGDPRAQTDLLELLERPDRQLVLAALEGLERMADARASDSLLRALTIEDRTIKIRVIRLLGRLGVRSAAPTLAGIATGRERALAREATRALARIRDPAVAPALIRLLGRQDRELRLLASQALAHASSPGRDAEPVLRFCRASAGAVRVTCVQALGGILRGRTHRRSLDYLLELMRGEDHSAFLAALDALAALRDRRIPPALMNRYPALDTHRRRRVLEVLGNDPRASQQVLPFLQRAARHKDTSLRASAAWAMGKLGAPRARPDLERLARDRAWQVQVNAAAGLARLGAAGDRDLLQVLASSPNPYVRANALLGVVRARIPGAARMLGERLRQDRNPWVRLNALRGLMVLGLKRFKLADGRMLKTPEDVVKVVAAEDTDFRVRAAARRLLEPGDSPPSTWIGLTLLDHERRPLRNTLFVLVTPGGLVKAAYSDGLGEAWEEGLKPGRCHVEAPGLKPWWRSTR